jgi:hypothetical protein
MLTCPVRSFTGLLNSFIAAMPRPLFPPQYAKIPTPVLLDSSLSVAHFHTLVLLRALAWDKDATPSLPFKEVCARLHTPSSTLYRHLSQLSQSGALSWHATGSGCITVTLIDLIANEYNAPPPTHPVRSFSLKVSHHPLINRLLHFFCHARIYHRFSLIY